MLKRRTYLLLALFLCLNLHAQTWGYGWQSPKHETRAVWLATIGGIDWPRTYAVDARSMHRQQEELCRLLDDLQKAGINTVLLQTRIRGTVIYPSKIEPYDDCLTGKYGRSPGYDPLQFAVEECHRRGMELHAWVVCIPLGTVQKQRAYGNQSILRRQPSLCKTVRGEVFMKPSERGTAEYIARLCREIVDHYDVDGISFDYIRYPEKTYGYTDGLSASERRKAISRIVQTVHDSIKPRYPWVKLSSSPLGRYTSTSRYNANGWECLGAVYQDPKEWLAEGWQDMLFPMMYYTGNYFYPFLFDWLEGSSGRPVIPGLGIYFLDPREGKWQLRDVTAQMHTARASGIGGIAFYRARYLVENHKGIFPATQAFCTTPALPLRMTWREDYYDQPTPLPPTDFSYRRGVLRWTHSEDQVYPSASSPNVPYLYYNVYADEEWPVRVTADHLIATRVLADSLVVSGAASAHSYFAVCACDRFGHESQPLQEPRQHKTFLQGRP